MFSPTIFTSIINSYLPEPHASLLNGIIFGVPLKTSYGFYQQLKIVGLLHLVVLSGINITILATIVGSLTAFCHKQVSVIITVFTIVVFIIFVGPQAPIIRAGFMGILAYTAILYGRKSTVLYSLFLSVIFIAIFWPQWLKTISFQLSYGATLGIIIFGKHMKKNTIIDDIKSDFWTSISAQIFTAPIIFIYFKQISLIAPFSNLLVSSLIPPLMIFGFLTAFLGKIHFLLGLIPSYICYGLLSYMIFVIELLSKIPVSYFKF